MAQRGHQRHRRPREGVFAEIHKLALLDGDTLLYCTDGLTSPSTTKRSPRSLNITPTPRTPALAWWTWPSAEAGPTM